MACASGCDGSNPIDNRLSRDCDEAQQIIWAARRLARALHEPEAEVPDWITHSICADAGLYEGAA